MRAEIETNFPRPRKPEICGASLLIPLFPLSLSNVTLPSGSLDPGYTT